MGGYSPEGNDKFTKGVLRSIFKPNRNSGLFAKKRRPKNDKPGVREEKDRLIAQFLETKGVTKCAPGFAHWDDFLNYNAAT